MNGLFLLDVFHHRRRGQRSETPCDSFLGKLIITLPIWIITNGYTTIKRLVEEKLSLMIGDGLD